MPEIVELKANKEAQEMLRDSVKAIRKLAESMESGEILSIAWIATKSEKDEFQTGYARTSGVSTVEMAGQALVLAHRLAKELDE